MCHKQDGLGRGDLYNSFMNTDDVWLKAVNMGDIVNAKGHELFPFVFKDGKYFIDTISQDISWVITEILDNYRK